METTTQFGSVYNTLIVQHKYRLVSTGTHLAVSRSERTKGVKDLGTMTLKAVHKGIAGVVAGLSALALSAPAAAFVSNLFDGASSCATSGSGTGTTRTCTNGGVSVGAKAHAFTGNGSNTTLESAILGVHTGGLGVRWVDNGSTESSGQPHHAMDNEGIFDMILLTFTEAVRLTEVWTKWVDTDSDITVLAHTGAGAVGPNGSTAAGLIANGWELVGGKHYSGPEGDSTALQKIALSTPANTSSTHWLIGAYNDTPGGFGGDANGADRGNQQYDYLKLYAVKGDKPSVPEPGALWLLGIALAGLWGMRRARC
jgi:hypothetical protein